MTQTDDIRLFSIFHLYARRREFSPSARTVRTALLAPLFCNAYTSLR